MKTVPVTFTVNDVPTTVETDPDRTLLNVLREDLDLSGAKKGCDNEGQCGACTVIVDGRAVRSCRTRIGRVAGKRVSTIEGIGDPDHLHPLQQAFLDHGAVQCGFCTPGLIMTAKALLDRNPDPGREQVARAVTGNLCRCTGYVKVIDAILAAGALLRGESTPERNPSAEFVGGDYRRLNGVDRVTGRTRFAGDIKMSGVLIAKVLRSPYAHARIISIDTTAALNVPGVKAVLTAADIPGEKAFTDLWGARDNLNSAHQNRAFEPILAIDRVQMLGDPVALVVADSETATLAGLERISVEYEPLEPIFDPQMALQPESIPLHTTGNLYERGDIKIGDSDAALAESAVQIEARYSIASRDHAALEPSSVLAYVDQRGRVVVIGPTHQPHPRQHQIAEMLAIPPNQVRVIAPPLGGSFGGRHHFWPVLAAALPAYLLQRPVRLTYTRREEFEATFKDHPFQLTVRLGAKKNGQLAGLWTRAYGDAGPYGGAPGIAPFVALSGSGPYVWPAIDYQVRVAHTNGANAGPLRGYGMPHGVLGLECGLDELAAELKIDPWELRMLNAADESTGTCTGQPFDEPFGFKQVLQAIKPHWQRAREAVKRHRAQSNGKEKRGAGLATAWYQFGKSGELRVSAQAELDLDGNVKLYYCAMNSGQGLNTVMSQLAADELAIPRETLLLINSDTDCTPDSHVYGAAKTTYWVGGAIIKACQALKRAILNTASGMLGVSPEQLDMTQRGVTARQDPNKTISLQRIATELPCQGLPRRYTGVFDLEARYPKKGRPRYLGHFAVGAALAEVNVNINTGKVKVLRVLVAQDVGTVINPVDVRGQIEGAAMMDLGAALMEEFIPGKTLDFKSYHIPRALDVPELEVIIVQVPGHDGPHGAKGVGEAASGHVRAAIINAIHNAVGIRVRQLPATPERVLQALGAVARKNSGGN